MGELIQVSEAQGLVAERIRCLASQLVSLPEALGLVLAESIFSDMNVPPLDCSAMDGYAVRARDLEGASGASPRRLEEVEEVAAGGLPSRRVEPGQAIRIMTGAPVPAGADAVVMVEHTRRGPGWVEVDASVASGRHIRRSGEDLLEGGQVLTAGRVIGSSEIGVLASVGCDPVPVYPRPRVAVLPTGDEIVFHREVPGPGCIRNSSGPALCAAVLEAGGVPVDMGIGPDSPEPLAERVRQGLEAADCLVTSAGVSVGDRDLVRGVLESVGMETVFWRVSQKPGKPLLFGMVGSKPVFGLPGYPVSSMMTFEHYVRPSIRRMGGLAGTGRRMVLATAAKTLRAAAHRLTWVRVSLERGEHGRVMMDLAGSQGSGVLSTLVHTDAILELPAGEMVNAGEEAWVKRVRDRDFLGE